MEEAVEGGEAQHRFFPFRSLRGMAYFRENGRGKTMLLI